MLLISTFVCLKCLAMDPASEIQQLANRVARLAARAAELFGNEQRLNDRRRQLRYKSRQNDSDVNYARSSELLRSRAESARRERMEVEERVRGLQTLIQERERETDEERVARLYRLAHPPAPASRMVVVEFVVTTTVEVHDGPCRWGKSKRPCQHGCQSAPEHEEWRLQCAARHAGSVKRLRSH
jgi:flagellar motility protein MotE (MotC chaperone)